MALIKLFANLRTIAGTKEISIGGSSIHEILTKLVSQKPKLESYLFENGRLRPHVIITINGNPTQNENAWVADQDILAIFPPVAGGNG